jgi:hypothetical protein
MKIYPQGMTEKAPTPPPTETPKAIADAVKARIKAIVTKPMDADHVVSVLAAGGDLAGVVDVYKLIEDVDREWHPEKYEAVAVEK